MKDYQTLTFDQQNGIAVITLNRPDAANGINQAMADELSEVALLCEQSASLRAVVLTATGRLFCGGGDVQEMSGYDDTGLGLKALAGALHRAQVSFANMRAPLIAAVNGTAAGAGFSMTLAADYALAVDSAKFTMAYTKIGLSPDGGASFHLPRLVGPKRAFDLIANNRVLSAAEACDMGLINEVVAADQLMEAAMAVAQGLAAGSIDANGAVKQLLRASADNSLEQQLELEARTIAANANSDNGREGVRAFVEKRAPKFR